MSGEPQPAGEERVGPALLRLTFVWLGLTAGLVSMTATLAIVVVLQDDPVFDPETGYLFLLAVPVGVVGVYVVAPRLTSRDPAEVDRASGDWPPGPGGGPGPRVSAAEVDRASSDWPPSPWAPGVGAAAGSTNSAPDPVWQETDPSHWVPAYAAQFILRAGFTEGPAVVCAIGFMLTGNWLVLGGVVVLLAALVSQRPTRAKFDAWLADARDRRAAADEHQ